MDVVAITRMYMLLQLWLVNVPVQSGHMCTNVTCFRTLWSHLDLLFHSTSFLGRLRDFSDLEISISSSMQTVLISFHFASSKPYMFILYCTSFSVFCTSVRFKIVHSSFQSHTLASNDRSPRFLPLVRCIHGSWGSQGARLLWFPLICILRWAGKWWPILTVQDAWVTLYHPLHALSSCRLKWKGEVKVQDWRVNPDSKQVRHTVH